MLDYLVIQSNLIICRWFHSQVGVERDGKTQSIVDLLTHYMCVCVFVISQCFDQPFFLSVIKGQLE